MKAGCDNCTVPGRQEQKEDDERDEDVEAAPRGRKGDTTDRQQ